ncbi:hypothetical protein [Streptomyces gardneri]|uniref:Low molecular weight antigen MTB12-like C-terminal domain-containing protein n=1 Tax=Streptomyces gardneri TaxID=66892 RepID=A0A4Y3RLM5_9ACTN|nr:hypothetical protein [Streptomyces gardneri]GEB57818.1 hypothetical protein SGA01_34230 [Streptomyces gardneri]GHH00348.1 hypothetical protein GCM10017674_35530 [Streptomyces gardneri]
MVLERLGGRPRLAALAAAALLALAPAVAGCSDDSTSGSQVSETPPPGMTALPPGEDEPADAAAAEAEITKNWTAFFDPKVPAAEKVKLLENGEAMQPVLAAFAGDRNAAMTSAKVTGVEFTSATEANVTYDLLVGGAPALPDSQGTTILQDDTWKVSVKTLCGLVELSGVTVPGC